MKNRTVAVIGQRWGEGMGVTTKEYKEEDWWL